MLEREAFIVMGRQNSDSPWDLLFWGTGTTCHELADGYERRYPKGRFLVYHVALSESQPVVQTDLFPIQGGLNETS